MSKWRPVPLNCLYVIPDIHGQLIELKLICNRIFPLRKSDGGKDRLVLLGDYIDRRPDGPEVVDYLIEAKKEYKDQLILLCGNHELMLLEAIKHRLSSGSYMLWMKNGGEQTLSRYLERAGQPMDNPYLFPRTRIKDIIPKEHLKFFETLKGHYETKDYIFVHGGCDPTVPLSDKQKEEYAWDRGLFDYVLKNPKSASQDYWEKTIVTGHNGATGNPFITSKFMMLDCSIDNKLLAAEMNSMEAFTASRGNQRLVKMALTASVV